MLRIVHLLDPIEGGDESIIGCGAAMRVAGRHAAWLLGSDRDEERARWLGVETTDRVSTSGGHGAVAARLRRLAADRVAAWGSGPDVVVCHSLRGLSLSGSVFSRGAARVALLAPACAGAADAGGAAVLADSTVAVLSDAEARLWRRLGAHDVRVLPVPHVAIGPTADPAQLRAGFGLDPDDVVVGMLTGPPGAADARRFVFLLGLLYAAGQRVVGMIPSGTAHARRAARFIRSHGRRWDLIEAEVPAAMFMPACDLVAVGPGVLERVDGESTTAGAVSIAAALSVPTPVISPPTPLTGELLGPVDARLVARNASVIAAAQRTLQLLEEPDTLVDVKRRMRHAAESLRSGAGFERTLGALLSELAGVPVERPGLPRPEAIVNGASR